MGKRSGFDNMVLSETSNYRPGSPPDSATDPLDPEVMRRARAATDAPEVLAGVCHGQTDNYWIVREREKYIYYPETGEEQLFDLEADPQELHDCSADTGRLQVFREHMGRIAGKHGGFSWDIARLAPCRNRPPEALYRDGQK